jgi:hypothetical protein
MAEVTAGPALAVPGLAGTPTSVCASGPAAATWFLWLAAAGLACFAVTGARGVSTTPPARRWRHCGVAGAGR